jgi:predicted metallo-beta-lactamase superfamily hydrolase
MNTIENKNDKFMFAPDVQGPMSTQTLEIIGREKPQLIMIGGPPSYLARFRVDEEQVQAGLKNLEKVVETVSCTILEHHILRDENWREKTENVFDKANKAGHEILTAAEFLGKQNALLEAARKRLFVEDPPSKEFEKWMRESINVKKHVQPPI